MPALKALVQIETQTTSFKTWTLIADSISKDVNCYAKHSFPLVSLHVLFVLDNY